MYFWSEAMCGFRIGIASQLARPRHALLIAIGFVIASATLILLLAIPVGLSRLAAATGHDDIAIIFAAGARDESSSSLKVGIASLIGQLPGVALDTDGRPMIAPQFLVTLKLKDLNGALSTVLMRGVTAATFAILGEEIRETAGRRFQIGINELSAGARAARHLIALDPGAQIKVRSTLWRVSGQFAAGGLWESELWADIESLQAAFNATTTPSVVWVKLESPDAFDAFATALIADKRLRDTRVERQRDYYLRQVGFVTHFATIGAIAIATALGIGALLAIANALTLALIARRQELAILRAIGFRATSLVFALLAEIAVLGMIATSATIVVTAALVNGTEVATSTGNQAIGFALAVTPEVMACAFAYTMLLALASAIWPAHQALAMPLADALRGD
jgi:putative ABC transport system permease protein